VTSAIFVQSRSKPQAGTREKLGKKASKVCFFLYTFNVAVFEVVTPLVVVERVLGSIELAVEKGSLITGYQ
jgi:hypothetical protein